MRLWASLEVPLYAQMRLTTIIHKHDKYIGKSERKGVLFEKFAEMNLKIVQKQT